MRSLYLILASFALALGHLSASTLEAEKFLKKAVTEVAHIADHSANSSEVRAKLAARIRIADETTALVVARPTPCAPPLELKPW